jgi:transposase-like protein
MRRYSEAVKADVRRRMSPPMRQSVAQISAELGIHVVTLYNWRKVWRLQGEVVPASEKEPEGWSAADKFGGGVRVTSPCLARAARRKSERLRDLAPLMAIKALVIPGLDMSNKLLAACIPSVQERLRILIRHPDQPIRP